MKYIKIFEGKNFFNIYYKLIKDLDIGDYVAIEVKNNSRYQIYKSEVGEIVDMSETDVYVYFNKYHHSYWIKKEYILSHSKIKEDIEDFLDAKKESEKYNL